MSEAAQSVMGSAHLFKNRVEPNVETSSSDLDSADLSQKRPSSEFSFLPVIEPTLGRLSVSLGLQSEEGEKDESSLFSHMVLPIENYEVTTILASSSQKELWGKRCKNEDGPPFSKIPREKTHTDPVTAVLDQLDQEEVRPQKQFR